MNDINEGNEPSNELNNKIVSAVEQSLLGLKLFGRKCSQVEATIESLLSAVSIEECGNVEIAELLQISRRRIASAKQKIKMFDDVVEKVKKKIEKSREIIDSDGSVVDEYSTDFGDENSDEKSCTDGNENDERDEIEQTPDMKDTEKENVFFFALSPKERELRRDKLNLNVVRDYCHEVCRLDTSASARVFVHDYDGNHSYHQVTR
jgi:chromosome segregation ATPase